MNFRTEFESTIMKRGIERHVGKFYTRKIAAKNIKVERRQSGNDGEAIQRFFEQQQQVLLAQTKIVALDGGSVTVPEEELYRIVETFCRHGKGAQCWQSLFKECIEPLTAKCLENIEAISQAGLKSITEAFLDEYDTWKGRILKLQHIYFYLDRSFLMQSANGGSDILRRCQDLVRDRIYGVVSHRVEDNFASVFASLVRGTADSALLLQQCEQVVRELCGESSEQYQRIIRTVAVQSRLYFKMQAEKWQILSPVQYLRLVVDTQVTEQKRIQELIDDPALVEMIMSALPEEMIIPHIQFIRRGVTESFEDENMFAYIRQLSLLQFEGSKQQLGIGDIFRQWIENVLGPTFTTIDVVIQSYLKSRKVTEALAEADLISKSADWVAGFRNSMKGKKNLSEQLAKFSDSLLRKGAKGGDSLKNTADVGTLTFLLSCIPEKDVFEVYYKRYLSKRLLVGRALGLESESELLSILRDEFGPELTESMETMLKDVRTNSPATMAQYRDSEIFSKCGNFDLNVNMLSQNAWPQFPASTSPIRLPSQMYAQLDNFSKFLSHDPKNTKKKITWQHALSSCTIRAHLNEDTKEFDVSLHQALVMLQFVDEKKRRYMTFQELQAATGISERELTMSLHSLMTPKVKILIKEEDEEVRYRFNWNFSSKLRRVKVPPAARGGEDIMLPHKAIKDTLERDRNMEIQAVIIRIMKARRTVGHAELVMEVLDKTKSRGILEVADVKKNISKLITDDFISRQGRDVYDYVA
ncbi:Cullin-4B [Yarrowia sp. B02]|nr:Cullin-4B [Yarrowia sp. B02]